MKNFLIIIKFLLIFSITYVVLLLPQTGIDRKYENFFRNIGNKLFGNFGKEGVLMLKEEYGEGYDTRIYLSKKSLLQKNNDYKAEIFPINSRRIGYISTAFLFALILATPLALKRKLVAMIIGLFLITLYAMLKLRVLILHFYTLTKTTGLYQLPDEKKSIEFWSDFFARPNTPVYYVVIIVWIAVSFSKKDFQKLNGSLMQLTTKPYSNAPVNNKKSVSQKHFKAKK